MMNISRQDVDNYFKSRPLKKLYLTKLGLFDEYCRNCLYNAGNLNRVTYPKIDELSGPFIWARSGRSETFWSKIEYDYKAYYKRKIQEEY